MKLQPLNLEDLSLKNLHKFAESRLESAEKELEKVGYDNPNWEDINEIVKDRIDAFNLGRNVAMRNLMEVLLRVIDDEADEIKQRLKSACELYLRYKNRPELLIKEHPEYEKDVENMKWIPNMDFEYCKKLDEKEKKFLGFDKLKQGEIPCNICPEYIKENCRKGEFIENDDFLDDYDNWLFHLVFKSVLEGDK